MFGQQREEKKECGLKSRILTKIAKHHHWLFFPPVTFAPCQYRRIHMEW